jgi:hypothetical protein
MSDQSSEKPNESTPLPQEKPQSASSRAPGAGRPTDFTQALADLICSELAAGVSLRTVCAGEDMPCMRTVFYWLRTQPLFLHQYARAKEESADALVEDILDIADNGTNDWMEQHDEDGAAVGWRFNGEALQRSKLRVDTRKWIAARLKPKKYGDRLSTEVTGADGGPIKVVPEAIKALSNEELKFAIELHRKLAAASARAEGPTE